MGPVFWTFDPAGVRRMAPQPLPIVLDRFLDWLHDTGGGAAERPFCELRGDWLDDFWIDHGSDLSECFSFFLVMGEGSRIGVWHGAGADVDDSPVVLVGSEGDMEFLGASTTHFLARLAVDDGLDQIDLPRPKDFEPFRSLLSDWLASQLPPGRSVADVAGDDPRGSHPDFRDWLLAEGAAAQAAASSDPTIQAIHALLETKIPAESMHDAPAWQSSGFQVACVAGHFDCQPPVAAPLLAQLEPLARAYRRRRADKIPGRGGWFEATFRRYPGGWATPACSFEFPPVFGSPGGGHQPLLESEERTIGVEDYQRDLADFPRSERWVPDWLTDLLRA